MSESFVKIITKSHLYKNLPDTYKVPQPHNSSYNHLTFNIKSLSEYIEVINILRSAVQNSKHNNGELIFRGMADHRWELLPSIARQTLITEETEYKMVKELMLLYPNEFSNISSNFDLLAKMQHYGLPTRLLDFTTNPLVALYFACQNAKNDSMARVISTNPSYPQYLDTIDVADRYIEAVCGLCKVKSFGAYFLEHLIGDIISFSQFIYCMEYPLIAKPKYSNDRIKNQSAVFMVFPNEIWDHSAMNIYKKVENKYFNPMGKYKEHQLILRENLPDIYPEIKEKSHPLSSWFATPESMMKVCQAHEKDIDMEGGKFLDRIHSKSATLFPHRFLVIPQIKKIDEKTMQSSFCSILIEPQYKKKILEELDAININERFIFPELEYTVKYIKEKYWSPYKN